MDITTRPLERIHSDVCCPLIKTWDGKRYFVFFLDDYTHFATAYLLSHKSEVFEKFREYEAMVTSMFNLPISKLRVDKGLEYFSNEQKAYYKSKGIVLEQTVGFTPQQNGVAERFNRTVSEKANSLMIEASIPKYLWVEAIYAATYLINRSPTEALKSCKTPAEMWYGTKPDVSKLRVFGCKAFAPSLK